MSTTTCVFCPVCTCSSSPILAPMSCTYIVVAPLDAREAEKPPYFSYRCDRCGYGEIHKRALHRA